MRLSLHSLFRPLRVLVALATALAVTLTLGGASAAFAKPAEQTTTADGATCSRPASDAHYLEIYPQAAAWDHGDLTVYVKLHPQTTAAQEAAVREAVDTWSAVLEECLDDAVSLTEVTRVQDADIVLRFLPAAGGAFFLGVAICHGNSSSPSQCNVIVSGGEGAGGLFEPSTPTDVYYTALHEIGHALGLGHAQPILETHDLMGYGWGVDGVAPVLSQCDVDALASIWGWAIEGTDPVAATVTTYDCA